MFQFEYFSLHTRKHFYNNDEVKLMMLFWPNYAKYITVLKE